MISVKNVPVVVVAGASGVIGRYLMMALKSHYRVIGLSRKPVKNVASCQLGEINWRQCDLFSMVDAEKALGCADYAFYLVHSMMPSAQLTQGKFEDMDLILADNFSRAAAIAGVKQIIYLGGLVPEKKDNLSLHLRSRLEVEQVLGSHGVPVTAIHAGLIIGAEGSTFGIMVRMIERLRFIALPNLMKTPTHPIALPDIIDILSYCLGNPYTYNQSFDVGGPDVLTYREMLIKISEIMGYKRSFWTIPSFSTSLAGILLSFLTGSSISLVRPLVESLKNPMVADNLILQKKMSLPGFTFEKAVRMSLSTKKGISNINSSLPLKKDNIPLTVRSVQRLPLPRGKDADWVALHYSFWLQSFFKAFIKVKVDFWGFNFYFRFLRKSLLELTFSYDRSSKDRALYHITGGQMASLRPYANYGRLEFREVLDKKYVLVAIHDYVPTLPWFIYSFTQARIHLWVMKNFNRHLLKIAVSSD